MMNAGMQGALFNQSAARRSSATNSPTSPKLASSTTDSIVPSGATAQTSGFAQAGSDAHSHGNPVLPPSAEVDPLDTSQNRPPASTTAATAPPAYYGSIGGLSGGLVGGFGGLVSGVGGGGGLASSPNVPKPGTSINPATGQPHTAGLTRAELEAIRAKNTGTLDTAPLTAGILTGNTADHRRVSDLTGREQAARQLAGNVQTDVITPGKELPGGWGPAKQVSLPGSGKDDAVASVYEDIATGLEKVGHAAYGLIPKGLKDALNPDLPVDKGKQPMGSPPKARRSSVGIFLENAKQQGEKVLHEVQEGLQSARRTSGAGTGPGVVNQVKTFFAEATQAADAKVAGVTGPISNTVSTPGVAGLSAPKKSLPSDEVAGALPGEHTSGVGALPGASTETGVAVLPDEKKPIVPETNQGFRPGEVSAAVAEVPVKKDVSASESTGLSSATDSSIVPSANVAPHEVAPKVIDTESDPTTSKPAPVDLPTAGSRAVLDQGPKSSSGTNIDGQHGLAPPLPATFLGLGAAKGATDLEEAGLPTAASTIDTPGSSSTDGTGFESGTAASSLHPASAINDDRSPNDRTTSNASITATRHGHEGQKPSPLAETVVHEDAPIISGPNATSADEADALKATKGETSTSGATSLTPGKEVDGVGHPSSRGDDTTREPGSYPKADHDGPVHETKDSSATGTSTGAALAAGAAGSSLATDSVEKTPTTSGTASNSTHPSTPSKLDTAKGSTTGATAASTSSPITPKSPHTANNHTLADETKGHQRTGSNASTGSNGKKKVGFMSKLKGEMKVIGGKLQNNDAKVAEGERLKHGE